jgi:hypothetical protein
LVDAHLEFLHQGTQLGNFALEIIRALRDERAREKEYEGQEFHS